MATMNKRIKQGYSKQAHKLDRPGRVVVDRVWRFPLDEGSAHAEPRRAGCKVERQPCNRKKPEIAWLEDPRQRNGAKQ
jgi:hypothetical protein